jgi:PilZ domain
MPDTPRRFAPAQSAQDRRRFFRLDDQLQMSLRRVSAEESSGAPRARGTDVMAEVDRRLGLLIAAARVQAPAVAELAELLNRKLDHVIQTLELNEELAQRANFREYAVNLSACGMALSCGERFEPGEHLMVEMLLPPNATRLSLQARAVKSTPRPDGGYDLKADFAGIAAEDQEFLIQYIMRRQSQLLQQMREERELRPGALAASARETGGI